MKNEAIKLKRQIKAAEKKALYKAAAFLEREIKLYIKEYGETHKVLRYKKDENGKTIFENGKAKKKLGPALTISGNYAGGWTASTKETFSKIYGVVSNHVIYAPFLEKHYKVAEIVIEKNKDKIREILDKEMAKVIK